MSSEPLTAESLRAAFERPRASTVGLEEELMLLAPEGHDLLACAPAALARVPGDARFKLELPAAHLEILTGPAPNAGEAAAQLVEARADLAQALSGLARPAAAGVHPFAAAEG